MLLGVDVGGTFTDAVLVAGDGTVHTAKAPSTPSEEQRGVMRAVAAVLAKAGAAAGGRGALRARHDGRHERPARGTHGAHGARRDRGLHRRDRARPPEPPAPLPAVRGRARAPLVPAELRFGAPERVVPEGTLRALDDRGRGRARASDRRRGACRRSRSRCCTPTSTRPTSGLIGAALRRRCPGGGRLALERAGRDLPRVRAHRDDRPRRGALAAARHLPRRACARRPRARAWPSRRSCSRAAASPTPGGPASTLR